MLREIWETRAPALVALAALALGLATSIVVIPETEQGVVMRLGKPVRVIAP